MNGEIVAIVAIACGTGITISFFRTIAAAIMNRRSQPVQNELVTELRSLREEVRALKQQNNDVILSLDTALHRVDQRLSYVETRGVLGARAGESSGEPSETQLASRG
jgi:hypothetical protein